MEDDSAEVTAAGKQTSDPTTCFPVRELTELHTVADFEDPPQEKIEVLESPPETESITVTEMLPEEGKFEATKLLDETMSWVNTSLRELRK